jgi:Flp pilus assembly protein TadG
VVLLIHRSNYFTLSVLYSHLRAIAWGESQAARDESGSSAVEFALVMPVALAIMLGGIVFGIAFNNYLMVTTAAEAGTFQLTVSRGVQTVAGPPAQGPWTNTVSAVQSAAPALTPSQLTITVTVNGTACSSDSACQTALSSAAGQQGSVSVSYPVSLSIIKTFMQAIPGWGASYASNITLTAQSTGRIQ